MPLTTRWHTIAESQFPWERDALDYLRERLPDQEPFRAWSNFEFIAEDGSIYEVDLVVLTAAGFLLIEIKSHPGTVEGDVHTWIWKDGGRESVTDNPIILANQKAKKLASLLKRQQRVRTSSSSSPSRLTPCAINVQRALRNSPERGRSRSRNSGTSSRPSRRAQERLPCSRRSRIGNQKFVRWRASRPL
jgi:hypothetical protein